MKSIPEPIEYLKEKSKRGIRFQGVIIITPEIKRQSNEIYKTIIREIIRDNQPQMTMSINTLNSYLNNQEAFYRKKSQELEELAVQKGISDESMPFYEKSQVYRLVAKEFKRNAKRLDLSRRSA